MIARTFDAAVVNALANHPAIHPWVSVNDDPIDLSGAIADESHHALLGPAGGFVAYCLGDGDYEAHSLFPPEGRGANALETARDGLDYMFTQTDCQRLLARCPRGNLAVLSFCRALGFDYLRTDKGAFPSRNGLVDQRWFVMPRAKWMETGRCR